MLDESFDEADVEVTKEKEEYGLFSHEFARRHGLHLLGTTSTWFLLDVAFYSQNLFQKDIFVAIGWVPSASSLSVFEEMWDLSRASVREGGGGGGRKGRRGGWEGGCEQASEEVSALVPGRMREGVVCTLPQVVRDRVKRADDKNGRLKQLGRRFIP